MIWTIIGIIVLVVFISIYQSGKEKVNEDKANYKQAKKYYNNPDASEEGVLRRLEELGVDISKLEKVKYYLNYFDNQDTSHYSITYMWPTEGAIAFCYSDIYLYNTKDNSRIPALSIPPSKVEPIYHELKDIKGLYRRNNKE